MRHLKPIVNVVAYEAKDQIGGVWVYSDYSETNHPNLQEDKYYKLYGTLHGSIYDGLIANLPKEIMAFKDFKHKTETPNFMLPGDFVK